MFTQTATGWKVTVPGATVTLTQAEADAFANLVKPDAAPAPAARPSISFTRVNQGTGGTGFTVSAGRDEFIVLQGFWRRAEIAEINKANPAVKLLVYKNLSRYSDVDAFGNYNSCVTSQEAAFGGGFDWTSSYTDSDYGKHILNPVPGTGDDYGRWCGQRAVAQLEASRQAGYPVDGVFFDDVNSSHDGNPCCRADWDQWMQDADREVGAYLKARGYLSMANLDGAPGQWNLQTGGWDERQLPFFDAVHSEFTSVWPSCGAQAQTFVNESFRLMGVAAQLGTIYVPNEAAGCGEQANTFSLGMCLVKAAGWCSKGDGVGNTTWWFPSFDKANGLGDPTGPPVLSGGVWMRGFQNGTVRVDLNARTATIG